MIAVSDTSAKYSPMETRVLWKFILLALFLDVIFIQTCKSLPLHESSKIATERHPPVPKRRHTNKTGVDIFDIILKANSKSKKISSAEGRMENRATEGHQNQAGVDIFDIILKANSKSKKFFPVEGMMESRATDEGAELFQGDIVMTQEIRTALENSHTDVITLEEDGQHQSKRAATSEDKKRWPIVNGQVEVPYVIEATSEPNRTVILEAMNHWHVKVPCIAFVPRTSQQDYLSFFGYGQGCYSVVGRKGGKQRISIGQGCAIMGVIAHEIGHALGFWHEQARPDRDLHVKILWMNILPDREAEFTKINEINDLGVDYDLSSLMHYGPKAFSKSPSLNTIERLDGSTDFGQRNGLSDKDIEQARLLYCPRTKACRTLYTDLDDNCPTWELLGQCDNGTNNNYIPKNCKMSCICKVCEDKFSNCLTYKNSGYCDNHKTWMLYNCRKTCGWCP